MVSKTGAQLRDEAIQQAEEHAKQQWLDACREVLDKFIASGQEFTSEDVREYVSSAYGYTTHENRAIGGLVKRAAGAGRIVRVRYGQSLNPSRHTGITSVWRAA